MTLSQRLSIKASEQRARLGELGALDELTPELRGELDTLSAAHTDTEAQLRAAIAADDAATPPGDPVVDAEVRERLELRSKTGLADFLKAAAVAGPVTGAASEYAAACGVPVVGHLPMAIFARTPPAVEERAITPGPAVKGMVQPTVPFVFERSAAASLGISMPSVPSGQVQIPRIETAPPSDTLAKDGAAPATAAAVTLVNQEPVRIAGQFEVRIEDLAVMPTLESALGESLQGSMSNELDESTFNGASGELNGLFTQATAVSAASAVETYSTGIKRFAELVDGKHAYSLRDLRAVIGSKTFALYAGLFANSNKGEVSLFDYLSNQLGSIRVSDRVPNVSSSAQKGIVVLSASAELPKIHVWDAMQIVRDPYSGAGAGKVTITATALVSALYIPHGRGTGKGSPPEAQLGRSRWRLRCCSRPGARISLLTTCKRLWTVAAW